MPEQINVRRLTVRLLKWMLEKLSGSRPTIPVQDTVSDILNTCDSVMEEKKLYTDRCLSIDTLSREVGTNRVYLARALAERGGFTGYVNGYRIRHVRTLVESDRRYNLKLSELAELSGFSTFRAMNYYIVKTYGCSAREFIGRIDEAVQAKNFSTSFMASGNAKTATLS